MEAYVFGGLKFNISVYVCLSFFIWTQPQEFNWNNVKLEYSKFGQEKITKTKGLT